MPMSFPDTQSIVRYLCGPTDPELRERMIARGRKYFRQPEDGEAPEVYRHAAADFARDVWKDHVLAAEIRTGRGWDHQTPHELLSELPGGLALLDELLQNEVARLNANRATRAIENEGA